MSTRLLHYTHGSLVRISVLGNGLVLGGRYRFTAESGAAGFIEEVKKIAEKEKHNPFALRSVAANFKDNLPEDEDRVETHRVDVKTVTHEAVIPKAILDLRHPNYFPAQAVTTFPEGQLIPGLTLRDIRLAFLIDQMFRDRFLFSTNPAESSRTGLPSLVRVPGKARTESVREIFRRGFCPCCGNLHRLEDCPVRKEYPPRSKCTQCQGEGHWSVDCETNPVSKASVSA
ncbi:hypothetical protein BDP27DRAFT_428691 [Rhodocollybia butyracea]|uniref:Uncharacterized protein n=1 Tax=Rhodocollybia butyracea TaxID=206335 RepID=A0A9P5Q1M8_9AGAR|nr:hypothetical protein BDP27DRAFT_428691 [Rhodocollybia butyracea]